MSQNSQKEIKPKISSFSGALTSNPFPTSPIIIDSDSSSEFSPLEETELNDDFDLNVIDAEISAELGEVVPINQSGVSSSDRHTDTFVPILPDTTEVRNPDEIHLSSDDDTKPSVAELCHPIVVQRNCSTQTLDSSSLTFSKQKLQHKQTNKYAPYSKTRTINRHKPSILRLPTTDAEEFPQTDTKPLLTSPIQSNFTLPPPLLPLPNTLPPIFTPNYAMAAAATLSAAALLQPFLQMQPPGFLNLFPPVPPVPPDDTSINRTEAKSPFAEGPSSTSDFIRSDTIRTQSHTSQPTNQHPVSKNSSVKPTIKWRNSSKFREPSVATEMESDDATQHPPTPSPLASSSTNPLPAFALTQLRHLSTEIGTGTNFDLVETLPDTTIPTLKTSYSSDPLFKLPSSPHSNHSNSELGSSGEDERIVTYNANPSVAGGRRVIEFSDLAPSTTSEAIENLARSIGAVEDFTFHQGLLYSRATVTFSIPKYALQCRRKFHRHYLDGVHISCNFLQGDVGPILKFPD